MIYHNNEIILENIFDNFPTNRTLVGYLEIIKENISMRGLSKGEYSSLRYNHYEHLLEGNDAISLPALIYSVAGYWTHYNIFEFGDYDLDQYLGWAGMVCLLSELTIAAYLENARGELQVDDVEVVTIFKLNDNAMIEKHHLKNAIDTAIGHSERAGTHYKNPLIQHFEKVTLKRNLPL